jgi:hypothetical protein
VSEVTTIQVGQIVPEFEMETYLPTKKDFGKLSLAEAKKAGKWTVLVSIPRTSRSCVRRSSRRWLDSTPRCRSSAAKC